MAEQTLTLSASGLFTKLYGSNEIKDSSSARQGRYSSYPTPGVGIIRFAGLADVNWATKSISGVSLSLTHGAAGKYNGSDKIFGIWGSNYQKDADAQMPGLSWISGRTVLGEFTRACSRDTAVSIEMTTTKGAAKMANFVEYLKSGNVDTFCLYMDETELSTGYNYSPNFLAVTAAEISITYDDVASVVNYGKDGEWVPCMVYHGMNGEWVPCMPYFGKGGEWISV